MLWLTLPVLLVNLFHIEQIYAADEEQSRLYNTREEKRDAGIKHEITPWLIFSGLAEVEGEWLRFSKQEFDSNDHIKTSSASVQLGFDIIPLDWAQIEILTEYDTDADEFILDEATLAFEFGNWEFLVGKQALDFGVFYSQFGSGPIIEFGETIVDSATVAYDHNDKIDVSVTAYRGDAKRLNSNNSLDWSFALEVWPVDYFSFGISYISDLADADSELLNDFGNRYQDRVSGLSAYFLWVADTYEISLEGLGGIGDFHELETDRNEPIALNLEFTYFLTPKLDWSVRLEGSHELEDEPEIQTGLALNYRIHENIALSTEILHGFFKSDLATDDDDNTYDQVTTAGFLITIAF